uniref:Uncharacterized protein n=1 Tax=Quercus lobata TaxID=97700 RepID=A0A7N2R0S6_QUELO
MLRSSSGIREARKEKGSAQPRWSKKLGGLRSYVLSKALVFEAYSEKELINAINVIISTSRIYLISDKGPREDREKMTLIEVGPRFYLNPIKIFGGSFGGLRPYPV